MKIGHREERHYRGTELEVHPADAQPNEREGIGPQIDDEKLRQHLPVAVATLVIASGTLSKTQ